MDTYTTPYYPTPLPIPAAKPSAYGPPYNPGYYPSGADSTYSVSPPEDIEVSSSSAGGPPSYSVGPSAGGSSRLGSECSEMGGYYDGVSGGAPGSSVGSASGVDLNEYMQERFAAAFEPARVAMDQCVLRQAQTSGHLNAKQRELLELQAKAQERLARMRTRFAQGLEDARQVTEDLEWTHKKLESLEAKAAKKHPKAYAKARMRYPSPDPDLN
ncbi:uncharacterized protein CTHT_0006620 [Thermochaetoides thermophila DSM 1495]|uniref:Biogenesis of lysosome-related organelles complex 1 subunit KXD1 n=1 Tax=Chaetomium thermophilum (strain DSM 1495 / CBS 144.50 / IMI 039719) TaxID=759272 RepID=G0RYG6_CHATD|nr:hypothetical protein CTHT_0006620 [Thermochaetoides thermophila DSM 1495]EGS23952.1 hypothetical protein CTHT_0006620 [Thermochaetoides thermophila DSM 1495]